MHTIKVGNKRGLEEMRARLSADNAGAELPDESNGRILGKQWAAKLDAPDALERLVGLEGWPVDLQELVAIIEPGTEIKQGDTQILGLPIISGQDDNEGFIQGFVIGAMDVWSEWT